MAAKAKPSLNVVGSSEERPFTQDLERMLNSIALNEVEIGYLNGSMSGESWKAFLKTVRDEVLDRLRHYSDQDNSTQFCASTLGPYREERKKIEREYMLSLVRMYQNAEKAYRSLSG